MATILIVDDYPDTRQYLREVLEVSSHHLLEAANGAEALGLVRAERPDLIITDILMPTMDGFEFARHLRADETIAQTPVIFYTGFYDEHDAEALAYASGVFRLITKPFKLGVLLGAVDEALSFTEPRPLPPPGEAFDREHLRLLTNKLSQNVAELEQQIANRRRAEAMLAAEARFLRAQTEVAQVALSSLQPEILVPQLLETIGRAQGYTSGFFWRVTDDGDAALSVATFGEGTAPFLGYRQDLSDPHSVMARAIRTGQPTFTNRVQESPLGILTMPRALGTQAILGLPLVQRTGSVMGAMTFADAENPERFTELDLTQGAVLASQVAQAIENSELFSQIQRLEEQYRVVTESLHDAVYTVDSEGQVTFVNTALERLTGYRREEVLGQPSVRLFAPEWGPVYRERLRQALREEPVVPPHIEGAIITKDGARVLVELSSANLVERGKGVGRVLVIRDMTERKRAEEEGRWRQRAAELMVELARSITASLDLDTVFQRVVEGARELCGSDIASIALRDPDSEAMVIRHWTGARFHGYEA
ncbi:MAG: PAS domain S-box protein, partial [Nitrospinae bacterium]|nr:PAS domain S-box protein [Nitrospinota bacterium]